MPHDIQTFSDVLAIDTHARLTVDLTVKFYGRTEQEIRLNSIPVVATSSTVQLDLFDPIELTINLTDFDEGTSGIDIEYFGINGLEVLPKYQHLSSTGGCYVDQLGIWKFKIPSKFYPWYHEISGQGFIA